MVPILEIGRRPLVRSPIDWLVVVVDHRANEGYVTPHEAAGEDAVYISRIRKDPTVPNGMVFWCVSDNLRKGAALNSVQIAELIAARGLFGRA